MRNTWTAVFVSTAWIVCSEFARNEWLFKRVWVDHYATLGLRFETLPVNGALWTIWSLLLAYTLVELLEYVPYWRAIGLVWLVAFVLMWVTLYNLQVLPLGLLTVAIPLSLLEVAIAGAIIQKLSPKARFTAEE